MELKKKKLSFIGKIDKIEKRMKAGFPPCISVSDGDGNKVIPAGEDPYPFLPDNVSAVHSRLFYEIFTLDINKEGVSPTDFIKVYGDGFKEGLQFLERERIDIDQLDDENKKANLIKRLKRILHDRKDNSGRTILNYGFSAQIIWTDKSMFEAGKHNGVITAIDQFAERGGLDEKDLKNEAQQNQEPETIDFKFENNFDGTPEKEVYQYFKTQLVDKGLLSIEDLHKYLKLAFEKEKYPEELFLLEYDYRKDAISVFFDYYKNEAGKPHGKKEKYVKLLGEYFKGFNTSTLMTNWAKSKY